MFELKDMKTYEDYKMTDRLYWKGKERSDKYVQAVDI